MSISKRRLAALISASASTAAAIFEAWIERVISGLEFPLIIASNHEAGSALAKFRKHPQFPKYVVVDRKEFPKGLAGCEPFNAALVPHLRASGVDVIGMYGFDPFLTQEVLNLTPDIYNQHPDIVPYFGGPGMTGQRVPCARLHFARKVGHDLCVQPVTHRAIADIDMGEIVQMGYVPILDGDTCGSLYARVKIEERKVQIGFLQDLCNGQVQVRNQSPILAHEEAILEWAKQTAIEHKHD